MNLSSKPWRDMTLPERLRLVFSLDLRSLALFRILLALLILLDLVLRSLQMRTFYTDAGVLPRRHWMDLTEPLHVSLHAASGALWWQIVLFLVAGLFALALLVGYRTRWMSIASFVMLVSLLNRNGLLLQAGDQLLVTMAFWAMFLPIGARWSVDAALQPHLQANPNQRRFLPEQRQLVFSVATIAVVFQVLYLYVFTAILKTGAPWRETFDAAFYAVSLQHFATPIGAWIRQYPGLLKVGTVYVLAVEFIAPILVLLPLAWPWLRIGGVLLLASLHVAFVTFLHIGLFPFIDFMSLSVLLPSALWIGLAARRKRRRTARREQIVVYYDEDCGFCLKMCLLLREFLLPDTVKILRAQHHEPIYAIMLRENSWVVTDADGTPYTHWHAMAFLFSQSPLFAPICWLMRIKPLMAIGQRVYRWVADNRGTMGRITAVWLPFRACRINPTLAGQALALLAFYVVTVQNITGIPGFGQWRPLHVQQAASLLRLDQRWDMFAPYPLTSSLYPVVPGTLRNGEAVELYPLTSSAPDWQPPEGLYGLYDGYRWRTYLDRVRSHRNNAVRRAFGDYQCRSWNVPTRARQQQLATLEVHFILWRNNTEGRPRERVDRRVWRHWCFPEFAQQ